MQRKRGPKEYLKNNLLSLFIFIVLMISGIVMAGNIIVNEGNLEVGNNLNISNVLFVNSTNGKVGIGTASPSEKLEIGGGGGIKLTGGTFAVIYRETPGVLSVGLNVVGSGNDLRLVAGAAEAMRILGSNGNVGIGTSTPTTALDLQTGSSNGNKNVVITFKNTTGTNKGFMGVVGTAGDYVSGSAVGDFFIRGQQDLYFVANEAGTSNMMIDSSTSNVGIGTTSPTAGIELDVEGQAECDGAGCWTVESDLFYKENIVNLSKYGLLDVLKIQPREYDYKINANNSLSGNHSFGFIAQELKLIVPEIVFGEEGNMSIGYGGLTPVLVKAVQEQQVMIQDLKNVINQMRATLCSDGHTEYC